MMSLVSLLSLLNLLEYYKNTANDLPRRHYYNRFVKDMKQFSLKHVDFMHFTVPLDPSNVGGFRFPGEYVGQYGVYEAVKHLYQQNKDLKGLVKEDSLYANKKYFATDLENSILKVKEDFRERHKLP